MFEQQKQSIAMLDAAQLRLLTEMDEFGPGEPEYESRLTKLERIHALKAASSRKRLDPNSLLLGAAHLLGIGVIVAFEKSDVWTSQAGKFIQMIKLGSTK